MGDYFLPYVPAAERRRRAAAAGARLRSQGMALQPVAIDGREIARTFWGKAWCEHLESFSDFANRLPRGRTYVRNGSVFHLQIERGVVSAKVQGSRLYDVAIHIVGLSKPAWKAIKDRCTGQIGSVLDLLQGKLSEPVMEVVTDRQRGLFPRPPEIRMECSCPDWARMCKHIAAALYGVGARLDQRPELLFLLRGVDHEELIGVHAAAAVKEAVARPGISPRIPESDLAAIFGVEVERRPRRVPAARRDEPFPTVLTGAHVTRFRKRRGLTKSALAALLGVSTAAVSAWERKKAPLRLQRRAREALREVWETHSGV